jgi:hypothetical protein
VAGADTVKDLAATVKATASAAKYRFNVAAFPDLVKEAGPRVSERFDGATAGQASRQQSVGNDEPGR